jgi:hypothetical protein
VTNTAKIKPISAKPINTMPISGFMPEKTIRDRWRFAPTVPMQRPVRGNRKTGYRKGKDIKQGLS